MHIFEGINVDDILRFKVLTRKCKKKKKKKKKSLRTYEHVYKLSAKTRIQENVSELVSSYTKD